MTTTELNKNDYFNECFKTIKANIKYSTLSNKNKVILITSANKSVGCTTIAKHLAESFSDDKKVLLIDANLRNPILDKLYNYDNKVGLTNVLFREIKLESSVYKYSDSLHVLFSGAKSPKPGELLDSEQMSELILLLKDNYDYIFIDAAPLELVADTQYLIPKCDSIVLVVGHKDTKKQNLKYAKGIINQTNGTLLGVIVNKSKNIKEGFSKYY